MLSSIILTLAMNASPVPSTDVVTLEVNQAGRKGIRIHNNFVLEKAGRKGIRINNDFVQEKTGRKNIRI